MADFVVRVQRAQKLEGYNYSRVGEAFNVVDARRHSRFKLEVAIRIYPRNSPVIRGRTVDMSESGISAMLQVEVPIGEVVRLEFNLDFGPVEVHATVRQRCAFRYGFQFVELGDAQDTVRRCCNHLAMKQPFGSTETS
jgi:PilZ domain